MDPDYGAALLRTLFTQAPVGLHVLDLDLRVVRFNSGAPGASDLAPDQILGHQWRELGIATGDIERMMRSVLETGVPVLDYTYQVGLPLSHPEEHTLSISVLRLEELDGRPIGLAVTVVDITERERAKRRLELLYRAGEQIGSTLDIVRTTQELTDVAVSGLADIAAVDILDSVLNGDAPAPGPVAERVALRRVAFGAAAGTKVRSAYETGAVRMMSYGTPYALTLSDLRPRRRDMRPDESWLADDKEHMDAVRAAGVHSMIVVPLAARGVVLGLMALYRTHGSPPFEESDVGLAADLAGRAATSVDNARRYTREHALARLTQRNLVPARLPEHAAVETAFNYLPVASGGVWYDVLALSGSRVALVAGEVSGSGMPTVTTMGRLRTALGALAAMDLPVEELLERLHDLTAQLGREYPAHEESPTELTATCLYVVYDPVTSDCTAASAGHPLPVVIRPDGRSEVLNAPCGPVLGRGVPHYTPTRSTLPPGSVLALRSATLIKDDSEDELRLYRETLSGSETGLWDACDTLLSALIPAEPAADAMLMLARTRAFGTQEVASWELPGVPESASQARRLVRDQLARWDLDDLDFGTELVASELVTNAVRYSEGPVELRLIRNDSLICEVSDVNSAAPHLRRAEDDDEGGRGLYLVAQFSDRWGTRHTPGGKTIWTEQPVT